MPGRKYANYPEDLDDNGIKDYKELSDNPIIISNPDSVEVPIDEFKINPIFFTKELDDLLTNKRTKLKKRVGKAYEWSKDKLGSLLQFAE